MRAFICDAPARAFLKQIKGHTGYFSCERCVIKGFWKNNRVTMHSCELYEKRTDELFSAQTYVNHQMGITPLVQHGIPCISSFVLDYMHCVCLGVVKRILWFFKQGPTVCKLSHIQLDELSKKIVSYSGNLPSEFARQPRSSAELERWKARV
ncbi:unnamed protein product [Mytilus coruscus]|nr:unnamed protein product [Mytilus coruscus]